MNINLNLKLISIKIRIEVPIIVKIVSLPITNDCQYAASQKREETPKVHIFLVPLSLVGCTFEDIDRIGKCISNTLFVHKNSHF